MNYLKNNKALYKSTDFPSEEIFHNPSDIQTKLAFLAVLAIKIVKTS